MAVKVYREIAFSIDSSWAVKQLFTPTPALGGPGLVSYLTYISVVRQKEYDMQFEKKFIIN